jgi:hypothetical protein
MRHAPLRQSAPGSHQVLDFRLLQATPRGRDAIHDERREEQRRELEGRDPHGQQTREQAAPLPGLLLGDLSPKEIIGLAIFSGTDYKCFWAAS